MQRFDLLGVKVSATNLGEAAQTIQDWARDRTKTYVCVAPVSTIVEARSNPDYLKIVNAAQMVTPDGMPVVWWGRRQGFPQVARAYGPDLFQRICLDGCSSGLKHFLFGGTPETLSLLVASLQNRYPTIKIVGSFSPPFRAQIELESAEILRKIEDSGADILWVGLGSPKQDFWMARHRELLTVPVMVGVGAAFDFVAGVKKQAPRWMQQSGFEWLFRLLCEPRRLWRRYLVGNSKFIYFLLTDRLFKKRV